MSQQTDDLEAVRVLVNTLEKFEKPEQERIIRWAREKLGLELQQNNRQAIQQQFPAQSQQLNSFSGQVKDLKSFIATKIPRNDRQFATAVAYYYKFEAPIPDRKESIDSAILQDATRLANRERLKNPGQTLRNSNFNGLLDKAEEKGFYKINTVGENLIAMTLPQTNKSIKKATKPIKQKVQKEKIVNAKSKKK
jgi:hypothetical protein